MAGTRGAGTVQWFGGPYASQSAAVQDGLALVKIPRWALATDGGQVAPARAMLLRDVQLVLRREQREFVTADAEDGFDSVVAQPQRNDLSTRV
jgi:hypothetical protein